MSVSHTIKPAHVVARAFELAKSGRCRSKREIALALAREGYSRDELEHLSGRYISGQLIEELERAPSVH